MPESLLLINLIICIPITWIITVTCIKRLHDLGSSGWLVWLLILPIFNLGICIPKGICKGNEFDNQYGPNPYASEKQ